MTTNWARALQRLGRDLAPAPGEDPLRLTMACRTSNEPGAPSRRHAVVVHRDWRVEVPHDLDGERVAAALGGYLSCIGLVDRAVPALREWMHRAARLELPPMGFRGEVDRWTLKEPAACCEHTAFRDPVVAADHWRSPQHVALVRGASPRQLSTLATASQRAHLGHGTLAMPAGDRERAAAACLGGDLDVAWLWDAGIHPRLVWTTHRHVDANYPLPGRFFLGIAWNRPDLRWVADTLAGWQDEESVHASQRRLSSRQVAESTEPTDPEPLVTWLAWTAQNWDVVDPTARFRWLGTGITRKLILALGDAGYDPDDVVAHAQAVGRTPDAVARTIKQWLDAGFHPSSASLTALARTGVPAHTVPSRAAVDRLRAEVRTRGAVWSLTDLALVLAEHGTVADAAAALRTGATPC
jgi:hypothetical protein